MLCLIWYIKRGLAFGEKVKRNQVWTMCWKKKFTAWAAAVISLSPWNSMAKGIWYRKRLKTASLLKRNTLIRMNRKHSKWSKIKHLKHTPPTKRLFYGWYILIGCFFLLFFQAGARHSFGVMFKPMIAQFGWNRASISLAFFVNMTIFALTLTIAGRFYDRYGPKWIIFISTVFMAGYPV